MNNLRSVVVDFKQLGAQQTNMQINKSCVLLWDISNQNVAGSAYKWKTDTWDFLDACKHHVDDELYFWVNVQKVGWQEKVIRCKTKIKLSVLCQYRYKPKCFHSYIFSQVNRSVSRYDKNY